MGGLGSGAGFAQTSDLELGLAQFWPVLNERIPENVLRRYTDWLELRGKAASPRLWWVYLHTPDGLAVRNVIGRPFLLRVPAVRRASPSPLRTCRRF